jgi:hypothetical protein
MKKKHIALAFASALLFIGAFAFTPIARAISVDPNSTEDLRADKSIPFEDFLASDSGKTYYLNVDEHRITGVDAQDDEAKADFENARIKHDGGPISNNGHDLVVNGFVYDFAFATDLRSDKTVPFRDFMNSDAPKTFYLDTFHKTISGVSDSDDSTNVAERSVSAECNSSNTSLQACMIGDPNYGVYGVSSNSGRWGNRSGYRQYRNTGQFTIDDGTSAGYTVAGLQPGDTVAFDRIQTIVEVVIL